MESSFVKALLTQPHLPSPIFCFADASPEMVAKKVCACLNEMGGWIVIGVSGKQEYVGLPSNDYESKVRQEITEFISPLPLVYVQQESFDGKPVLLVTVPQGSLTPYTYKGRYLIQKDNEIDVPTPDMLSKLLRNSYTSRSDWERVNNLYAKDEDLDERLMAAVYEKGLSLGRLSKNNFGLRGLLSELRLVRTGEVANGAVALFAYDTRNLLPQCRLRIQMMTRGKDADGFEDLYFIEGNVFTVQSKAINYFRERLPRVAYFFSNKTSRYNDFEYPLDVLDEAISNALIHRDYTDISDEVTIFIYADRIEITNSGRLPEKMVSGRSKVLPHGSVLRNPLMAEVFYVAGEMEKTGRGMLLISNTMRDAGRKLPEWTSSNGKTTLIIYNRKEVLEPNERIRSFVNRWPREVVFSKTDYMTSFERQPSKVTAQNDLLIMLKTGLCEKLGSGPKTMYRLLK